ncbi:MAG: DUF2779 domain-containing protein [Bacilli bacterium]|nr:DUF2779 domain-containing protein [Bacilli bacterium]
MYLSKSKYCNAIQCPKILWLDKNKPQEKEDISNQSVLDNGTEVGIIAKDLFGPHIDIEFSTDLQKMINETNKALEKDNIIITEASFSYNNNFCSIDILKKNNNNYEIYEVKSSTEVKDIYLDDISYQTYVLKKLGHNITKTCIVYINSDYERDGDLDLNKLFIIKDVTDISLSKQKEVEEKINYINDYMKTKEEPKDDIGIHCVTPYNCPFFKYCTKQLPANNIFNIKGMRSSTKFDLYHKGLYDYKDLLDEDINWKYKEQIEYSLYDKAPFINKNKIKDFLSTLSYPLYFLDFETYQQSIPQYDGIKPYMQIPFQYSLHYLEKENSKLMHKEFLASSGIDPRRTLAESLIKDIPKDTCVLAYNMMFEKMVIKNLANLYPDLTEHLMNIYYNIKDLMIPFKDRDYYTKEMDGSYSIKYVLPALFPNDPSLDYHNLDQVHNGQEAMSTYANLNNLSKKEQEEVRNNLLKYCELDTYAMVKIYKKLKEL